jgi:hypothetical protein
MASSLIALFGIALYPPSKIRWLKYFYVLSAGLVVILIVVNILALQSPKNVSTQVQRPIDMFVTSVTEGGVNLEVGPGEEEGSGEEEGTNPGQPQPGQEPTAKP